MRSLDDLARLHSNFQDYITACANAGYQVNQTNVSNDIIVAWAKSKGLLPTSSDKNKGGKTTGGGSDEGTKVTDFFTALKSSASFDTQPSIDVATSLQSISDAIFSLGDGSIWSQPSETIRQMFLDSGAKIISELVKYYQEQSALMTSINQRAGLSFEFAEAYRKTLTDVYPKLIQYGITFSELAYVAENLVKNTGRFYTLNEQTFTDTARIAKAYLDDLNEIYTLLPAFERVGLGASNAMESIARAGKDSISLGLRAQTVTKELTSNIGKLNEYGFKNGTDGLTKMVQKSIEFRMSMNEVFKIADKVMSPEGAIELSANLQVLGGAIGDFNDPMKLMYMATNNVEGLQDALIKSAGNLATYNQEQKRFEITGVNLRMAREMASQLGISYGDLAQGAIAAAEKSAAASEMMRAGLVMDDEDREFITNISKMKDGKMVIDLGESKELQKYFGGTSVALENLDQRQIQQIKEYRDTLKKKSEEDIIQNQYTSITNIENTLNSIAARARVAMGRGIDDIGGAVFKQTKYLAEKLGLDTKKYEKPQDLVNAVLKFGNTLSDKELRQLDIVKQFEKFAKDAMSATQDALNLNKTKTPTTASPTTVSTTTTTSAPVKTATTQNTTEIGSSIKDIINGMTDSFKNSLYDVKSIGKDIFNLFDVSKSSESHLSNIRTNINQFLQNSLAQTNKPQPSSFIPTTKKEPIDYEATVASMKIDDIKLNNSLEKLSLNTSDLSTLFRTYYQNTLQKTDNTNQTKSPFIETKSEFNELLFDLLTETKNNNINNNRIYELVSNSNFNTDDLTNELKTFYKNYITEFIKKSDSKSLPIIQTVSDNRGEKMYESDKMMGDFIRFAYNKIEEKNRPTIIKEYVTPNKETPVVAPTSFIPTKYDNTSELLTQSIDAMTKYFQYFSQTKTEDKNMSVTHKHTHEHIIKAPAVMDLFARAVFRDPNILNDIEQTEYRSYTVPETKGATSYAVSG